MSGPPGGSRPASLPVSSSTKKTATATSMASRCRRYHVAIAGPRHRRRRYQGPSVMPKTLRHLRAPSRVRRPSHRRRGRNLRKSYPAAAGAAVRRAGIRPATLAPAWPAGPGMGGMETTPAQAATKPRLGRYDIDPAGSAVRFRTRHLFGLAPVRGRFQIRAGTVDVTEPASESRVSRGDRHGEPEIREPGAGRQRPVGPIPGCEPVPRDGVRCGKNGRAGSAGHADGGRGGPPGPPAGARCPACRPARSPPGAPCAWTGPSSA